MAADAELLLRLTTQLADGQPVDWQLAAELEPTLREQLRQLELLAGGFGGEPTQSAATGEPIELPQALREGERFGPLRIDGQLGQGSFGRVYRAHDPELQREVALKLIDGRGRSRVDILREARLLARVDHPNVLRVFGALEDGGRIGLAFELIEGQTMERWLVSQPAPGAHGLVAIGLELAGALCALHQVGIVHGDLKPANILRHPGGRWIVADLGSGRQAEQAGVSAGTPRYMAPELFDEGEPTAASDQYALGVVLFRLATGQCPVEGEDVVAIALAHQSGQRQRLLDLRPDLPGALVEAIERALAADPARRHASLGHFAAALSAVITGIVPERRPSRTPPALLAAAVVLMISLGLVWSMRSAPPTPAQASWLASDGNGVRALQLGDMLTMEQGLVLELDLPRSTHVYVFNQDQAGRRYQLFPLQAGELRNPLPAGPHRLPGKVAGEIVDWRLSSNGGREFFLLVLSNQPIPELTELAFAEAGSESSALLAMQEPIRGVGALQPRMTDTAADWSWVTALQARYPQARFERFELAAP